MLGDLVAHCLQKRAQKSSEPNAKVKYMNIINAVNMSFFKNNSFIEHKHDDWKKVAVDPDLVRYNEKIKTKKPANDNKHIQIVR